MARLDKCPAELQHTHRLEPDDYRALSPLLAERLVREAYELGGSHADMAWLAAVRYAPEDCLDQAFDARWLTNW